MTRYLVTGAAGNLSRLLIQRLKQQGKEVVQLDRQPPVVASNNFVQADITDTPRLAALIDEIRPECILHMASLLTLSSEANPATAWQVNANASIELLRIATDHGVDRVFFPSTIATYSGELPDPLPEDHPQWPMTIYGVTKVAVERMGVYLWQTAGLDFRAVRLPFVISPYAPSGAVSAYPSHGFIAAHRGETFVYPAPPNLRVSSLYVTDVINGILRLIDADADLLTRRVYNLHAFSPSTQDFANAVSQRIPEFTYRFEPQPDVTAMTGTLPSVLIDTSARRDWGWNPLYDLAASADDIEQLLKPQQRQIR